MSKEEFNWSRLSNAIDQLQFKSIGAKNDLWDNRLLVNTLLHRLLPDRINMRFN